MADTPKPPKDELPSARLDALLPEPVAADTAAPATSPLPPPACCSLCEKNKEAAAIAYNGLPTNSLVICQDCAALLSQPQLMRMVRVMVRNYQLARDSGFKPANPENERIAESRQKIKKVYGS